MKSFTEFFDRITEWKTDDKRSLPVPMGFIIKGEKAKSERFIVVLLSCQKRDIGLMQTSGTAFRSLVLGVAGHMIPTMIPH